jgi:hypothetical protein
MRQWTWLYPAVEILHIMGFVIVVGAAFFFDLRLLGLARSVPVTALASHLLSWARAGFAVVVPTGLMMFTAHATEMASNPVFRIKLILVAAGVLNAAAFHQWPFKSVDGWNVEARAPAWAKATALVSLLCWSGAIACGRLLAYF